MIENTLEKYNTFINKCYVDKVGFKLTLNSEVSPYATCFGIFGKNLVNDKAFLRKNRFELDRIVRKNLDGFKLKRERQIKDILTDKPYLQLLTFSLTALCILKTLKNNPLEHHVLPIVGQNLNIILKNKGTFKGKAGTGNLAMFYAILMIHTQKFFRIDQSNNIKEWMDLHLSSMNESGFWGNSKKNPHLQFQNGYHQYEIFYYLKCESKIIRPQMESFVKMLVDKFGHFSPYPGGGGCFDYDAVFLLTLLKDKNDIKKEILSKVYASILNYQNIDGGFCESKKIRPINLNYFKNIICHVYDKPSYAKTESLKYCLNLIRKKHSKIKTHWTVYDRDWNESNLWDSWFRVLSIFKIDQFLEKSSTNWGIINYPGIGYYRIKN